MSLKMTQSPSVEPVSLDDMKLYLRVDSSDEDDLIKALIQSAREYIETYTRRALPIQQWTLFLDQFPTKEILIPKPPLVSVESITYKDKDGVETVLPTSDYIVDVESEPGKIVPAYGKTFPSIEFYPVNAVKVNFTVGYESMPEVYVIALKMLVAHFYENRLVVFEAIRISDVPFTVHHLLYPIRNLGWS